MFFIFPTSFIPSTDLKKFKDCLASNYHTQINVPNDSYVENRRIGN